MFCATLIGTLLAVTFVGCSHHAAPLPVVQVQAISHHRDVPEPATTTTTPPTTVPAVVVTWPKAPHIASVGSGRCGGDLPPCSVMYCENGGKLTGKNPSSSASGKWQILDSTWGGYGGYSHAQDAPESVQDAKARQIYAGGAGRSQWVC